LLAQARQRWEKATLVFVTHDIAESLQFDRVLVLEKGRIVQDGRPEELADASEGSFSRMLQAQTRANQQLWEGPAWRRLSLDESGLSEKGRRPDAV
jgi:ATP-binding cassette subfamily B protein